jgi:hypothetical protein
MSQHEYSVGLARPRTKEEIEELAREWLKNKELGSQNVSSDKTVDNISSGTSV